MASVSSHVRRIVLYGRPSSGKTCFLAALAMARDPNPLGYNCIWVNDTQTIPMPSGEESTWDKYDPVANRFLGKQWLKSAIATILKGDVPPATPSDAPPYRLYFDLTRPNGHIQRLEMIDYSGELVDTELSEDKLVKNLIAHMEEADGVLVLAEAPRPGEKPSALFGELLILQQALMQVSEKRRRQRAEPLPIAMILNKWDRFTKMQEYDPESARIEINEYMDQKPPVPQKVLFDVLKSVAMEESFSTVFPASAFGKTKTVQKEVKGKIFNIEVPLDPSPLPSYGLEDPLAWVCDRSDGLELRNLQQSVRELSFWKLWQIPSRKALVVRDAVLRTRRRFPTHLPQATQLAQLARDAVRSYGKQWATLTGLVAVLSVSAVEGGFWAYDEWMLREHRAAILSLANPGDPVDLVPKWKAASDFLVAYSKPAWHRTVSHAFSTTTPSHARVHYDAMMTRLDEAARILSAAAEYVQRLDGLVNEAIQTTDQKVIGGSIAKIEDSQPPEDYSQGPERRTAAANKVRDHLARIKGEGDIADLKIAYNDYLGKGELTDAIALLDRNAAGRKDLVEQLRNDFRLRWADSLNKEIARLANSATFDQADRLLQRVESNRAIIDLVGSDLSRRCREIKNRLDEYHADVAYSDWFVNKDFGQSQNAVIKYGTDEQKKVVRSWQNYKEYLNSSKTWKIKITQFKTSRDGGWFGATNYSLSAKTDSHEVARGSFSTSAGSNEMSLYIDGSEFQAKPREALDLRFALSTTNWNPDISFSGSWSGTPDRLISGAEATLKTGPKAADPTIKFELQPVGFSKVGSPSIPDPRTPTFK